MKLKALLFYLMCICILGACQSNKANIEPMTEQEKEIIATLQQENDELEGNKGNIASGELGDQFSELYYPSAISMCHHYDKALSIEEMHNYLEYAFNLNDFDQLFLNNSEEIQPLNEALLQMMYSGDKIGAIVYSSDTPKHEEEVHIVAVGLGEAANSIAANGLYWYEDNQWYWQAYPEAPQHISEQRRAILGDKFCAGVITRMYQSGEYLAAVVYMGVGSTRPGEEVHLLKRENGSWHLLWAPVYNNHLELLQAEVELQEGISTFTVYREAVFNDPSSGYFEEWKLVGEKYVLITDTETD